MGQELCDCISYTRRQDRTKMEVDHPWRRLHERSSYTNPKRSHCDILMEWEDQLQCSEHWSVHEHDFYQMDSDTSSWKFLSDDSPAASSNCGFDISMVLNSSCMELKSNSIRCRTWCRKIVGNFLDDEWVNVRFAGLLSRSTLHAISSTWPKLLASTFRRCDRPTDL